MRINKFVAQATGLSRRAADRAIRDGKVAINQHPASLGDDVGVKDVVTLGSQHITINARYLTIMVNKPAGYVCSRRGQGSHTIYELLPPEYHLLKPVGRLDKDSSGLFLLTSDGNLANRLTHPRYAKLKVYEISLDKPLALTDRQTITNGGVRLDDGPSRLILQRLHDDNKHWQVTMKEGRNRQIRRTFAALGYEVKGLHRTRFGDYHLADLQPGQCKEL